MILPLLTTTDRTNGNPGDAFIQLGLSYLINLVKKDVEYLLVSKDNKADFADKVDIIKRAGQMIYAGTPQYNNYDDWCFWYDWGIWQDYIIPMKLKFHSIAGGSGFPDPLMTPDDFAKHCLSSERTRSILNSRRIRTSLCIVRDEHSDRLLTTINQPHHLLPCTAVWSGPYFNLFQHIPEYTVLVPPDPSSVLKKLKNVSSLNDMKLKLLSEWGELYDSYKDENPIFVCNGKEEYRLFSRAGYNTFYSNELYATLNMYRKSKRMISSRLHACLPAYGMHVDRILSIPIDTRGNAVKQCGISEVPINKWNVELIREKVETPIDTDNLGSMEKYIDLLGEVL